MGAVRDDEMRRAKRPATNGEKDGDKMILSSVVRAGVERVSICCTL